MLNLFILIIFKTKITMIQSPNSPFFCKQLMIIGDNNFFEKQIVVRKGHGENHIQRHGEAQYLYMKGGVYLFCFD